MLLKSRLICPKVKIRFKKVITSLRRISEKNLVDELSVKRRCGDLLPSSCVTFDDPLDQSADRLIFFLFLSPPLFLFNTPAYGSSRQEEIKYANINPQTLQLYPKKTPKNPKPDSTRYPLDVSSWSLFFSLEQKQEVLFWILG